MIIVDVEQGSPEWHAARCGKATGSRMADLTAKTKSGYSASRANYAAELVVERLTGRVADRFVSAEMQWGTDKEQEARNLYSFMRNATLELVGFVLHKVIAQTRVTIYIRNYSIMRTFAFKLICQSAKKAYYLFDRRRVKRVIHHIHRNQ